MKQLKKNKDYASKIEGVLVINRNGEDDNHGIMGGVYYTTLWCIDAQNWREVSQEYVKEVLLSCLEKKFGRNWKTLQIKGELNKKNFIPSIEKIHNRWVIFNENGCLYNNGLWAEVL